MTATDPLYLSSVSESARHRARAWLMLATSAVAAAGMFAILIALARVPAMGKLFPGPEFYRVALTLHVDLSQWVWFMAFSGMLWSLSARRMPAALDWLALILACLGALAMTASPLLEAASPLMSNYLPVLGGQVFLTGLLAYGLAVLIKAVLSMGESPAAESPSERASRLGLMAAAACVMAALLLLAWSYHSLPAGQNDHAYFESLFWGAGHVWQFSLTTLMMVCWVGMAPSPQCVPPPRAMGLFYVLGAMPAIGSLAAPLFFAPQTPGYAGFFTDLMRWTSWEIPLILGLTLVGRRWRSGMALPAGLGLSVMLFVTGLVLGTAISAQTTLVTAHYHGTVGAVTLAFMAFTYRVLPLLGFEAVKGRQVRLQLGLYGWGIWLMMAGLAGAGLMGAPRKVPGNLGLEMNVETASRLLLGFGGTLATIGILMFAFVIAARFLPRSEASGKQRPSVSAGRRDIRPWAMTITLLLVLGGGWLLQWQSRSGGDFSPGEHAEAKIKTDIETRFQQGVLMLHAKQYEHAMTSFHRVLQLAPEMPEAHVNMGYALLGLKRYKEARDFFESATQLRRNQINAYYGLAEALEGMGDLQGALGAMETYLHLAKSDDPFRQKAEAAIWEWRAAIDSGKAAKKSDAG